jgi:hypothetical protein
MSEKQVEFVFCYEYKQPSEKPMTFYPEDYELMKEVTGVSDEDVVILNDQGFYETTNGTLEVL